jgi:hypothetical protein
MFIVICVLAVVLVATLLWFSPLQPCRRVGLKNYFGAALLIAWLAGVSANIYQNRQEMAAAANSGLMAAVRELGPIDWEGTGNPILRTIGARSGVGTASDGTSTTHRMEVAPVSSLIGGLEARLALEPKDASGWALLAQSYAFVGRTTEADAAMERAVRLGVDEASLRDRVASSAREAQAGNWIEQAIRH